MSANKYVFDDLAIAEVASKHQGLLEQLTEALSEGEAIMKSIKSYKNWQGKQKEELVALMTIIISYHGDIVGKKAKGYKSKGLEPYQKFIKAFSELDNQLGSYTKDAKSYKELNSR